MAAPIIDMGTVTTYASSQGFGVDPPDEHDVPFPAATVDGSLVLMAGAHARVHPPDFTPAPYAFSYRGVTGNTSWIALFDPGRITTPAGTTSVNVVVTESPGSIYGAGLATVSFLLTPDPPAGYYDAGGQGPEASSNLTTDLTFDPDEIEPGFDAFWEGFLHGTEDVLFVQTAGLFADTNVVSPAPQYDTLPSAPTGWSLVGEAQALHLDITASVQTIRCGCWQHTETGVGPGSSVDFPQVTVQTPSHTGQGGGYIYPLGPGAYWGILAQP